MLLQHDDNSSSIRGSRFRRMGGLLTAVGAQACIMSLVVFLSGHRASVTSETQCVCNDTMPESTVLTMPQLPKVDQPSPSPRVEDTPPTAQPIEYAATPQDESKRVDDVQDKSLQSPAPTVPDSARLTKYLQQGAARPMGVIAPGYEVTGLDAGAIDRLIGSGSAKLVVAETRRGNQYDDADFYEVAWTPSGPRAFYQLFRGWPEELHFSKRVITNLKPSLLQIVAQAAAMQLEVPTGRLFIALVLPEAVDERVLRDQRTFCDSLHLDCEKVVKTTGTFRWSSSGGIDGLKIEEVRFHDGKSVAVRELAEAVSTFAAAERQSRPGAAPEP